MSKSYRLRLSPRRRFLIGSIALAGGATLIGSGLALAVEEVKESAPQAKALDYHLNATKVRSSQRKADAFCHNCQFYSGKKGEKFGPCAVFGGQLVSDNGWCTAWLHKQA